MTTPRPRRTRWLILLTGSLLFLVLLPLACRLLQEKSLYSVPTILLRPDGSDPSTFLSLRGFLLLKHFFTALGLAMLVLLAMEHGFWQGIPFLILGCLLDMAFECWQYRLSALIILQMHAFYIRELLFSTLLLFFCWLGARLINRPAAIGAVGLGLSFLISAIADFRTISETYFRFYNLLFVFDLPITAVLFSIPFFLLIQWLLNRLLPPNPISKPLCAGGYVFKQK